MTQDDPRSTTPPEDRELTTRSLAGESGEARVLGRYRLLEPIGTGGMSVVDRAGAFSPDGHSIVTVVRRRRTRLAGRAHE